MRRELRINWLEVAKVASLALVLAALLWVGIEFEKWKAGLYSKALAEQLQKRPAPEAGK